MSQSALHKFVIEKEGDRNNRKRLREFSGFQYDEIDAVYEAKSAYVQAELTVRDLTSICLILNISHDVETCNCIFFKIFDVTNFLVATKFKIQRNLMKTEMTTKRIKATTISRVWLQIRQEQIQRVKETKRIIRNQYHFNTMKCRASL